MQSALDSAAFQMPLTMPCRYGLPWHQAFKACMYREWKLFYRDKFAFYSSTFQVIIHCFLSVALTLLLHTLCNRRQSC